MSYAYVLIAHCSINSSLVRTNNFLFLFFLNLLSVVYTVFVKEFYNSILVLIITICAEAYLVVVSRLLCSFCYQSIEFIANLLNPFSDGKCYEQSSFSFNVEIGVCITLFIVPKAFLLNPFLFFLTKLQNSSIS